MKIILVAAFSFMAFAGCATLPGLTSKKIDCPEEEIRVVKELEGLPTTQWVAECRSKLYYCSKFTGQNFSEISCIPELEKR
jgi:hypothetical protein